MRLRRYAFWQIVVGVLGLSAGAIAAEPAAKKWSTEQLVAALIRQQAVALDTTSDQKGCRSAMPNRTQTTLGDYLAFLTASLDAANGRNGVASTCAKRSDKNGSDCTVMFSTGGGTESPWSYGVRFEINDAGQLNPKSLSCPGGA